MEQELVGVFGCSGFGREVMPILVEQLQASARSAHQYKFAFVDDNASSEVVNGYEAMNWEQFLTFPSNKSVTVAIANPDIRKKIHLRASQTGIPLRSAQSIKTTIYDNVELGEGCILTSGFIATSNIIIGDGFQANLNSYVAHDCKIGNFVTFAPCVKCNGNVIIEDDAYIGTGTIIKQGKPGRPLIIGKAAKIEAGSYVTKSVAEGETVFGSPARPMTIENLRKMNK